MQTTVDSKHHGSITVEVDLKNWATFTYGSTQIKKQFLNNEGKELLPSLIVELDKVPVNGNGHHKAKRSSLPKPGIGEDATLRAWYKELRNALATAARDTTPANMNSYFVARSNYRQLCRLRGLPVDYRAESQRDIDRRNRYRSFRRHNDMHWYSLIIGEGESWGLWWPKNELSQLAEPYEFTVVGREPWGKKTVMEIPGDLQVG